MNSVKAFDSAPMQCGAGDRHHDAMYRVDRRRVECRVCVWYGTEQGGVRSSFRSVISQDSDGCGAL